MTATIHQTTEDLANDMGDPWLHQSPSSSHRRDDSGEALARTPMASGDWHDQHTPTVRTSDHPSFAEPPGWHGVSEPAAGYAARPQAQVQVDPNWNRAAAWPALRSRVANRLDELAWNHTREAWERRRNDPLSPHALAFVYAEPWHGQATGTMLRTATRLFFAADAPRLAPMLVTMAAIAEHKLRTGGDVRRELANRHDAMSTHAQYVGLGISTLDTLAGDWRDVQREVASEIHVPARCYGLLDDGSRLLVDRLAGDDWGTVHVVSTGYLARQPGDHLYRYTPSQPDATFPGDPVVWERLAYLHYVIKAGQHDR
jgi:hypothetical protein